MQPERFRASKALAPLKAFQRRTVDYVFDRLYGTDDNVRQFLVADEVGLGKTMVARGVIARMIEHLQETVEPINILYICSNQAIAAQNINRLNVLDSRELALPTRMTLIPLQLRGTDRLGANKVNFISFTPGTTFDLRSATGVRQERALLFRLLEDLVSRPRRLHNLLQVSVGIEGWKRAVKGMNIHGIDTRLIKRFHRQVQDDQGLFQELERVCELFPRRRAHYPPEITQPRNSLIARLRSKLSHACIDALQPNLIIMDEFQRFRDLLHGDSDAAVLAQKLFAYSSSEGHAARTLLLSATPYRMLTLTSDDPDAGDHYQDFLETLRFLYGRDKGPEVVATLAGEMRTFRRFLHDLPLSRDAAVEARKMVEQRLHRVMTRTERVGSTAERDSMLFEPPITVTVAPADLAQATAISQVARALDAPDIVEYWKSAPYLLNFMRDYRLKRLLEEHMRSPSTMLREAILAAGPTLLDRKALDTYQPLEPANGRMRAVMDDLFERGLERHLWIPAAMPYYGAARPEPPLTKALVFSSWSMVPDALSALLSYESERRMGVGESGQRYFERYRSRPQYRSRPLQFRQEQGRSASLRTLLLIYPSAKLAEIADPLSVFVEQDETLSTGAMRHAIAERLGPALDVLRQAARGDSERSLAEWAAPAVLDEMLGSRAGTWLTEPAGLTELESSELASKEGFREHVAELGHAAATRDFGAIPEDLRELLVDVALGSPAVCALRALRRIAPELAWDDPQLLSAAARVAWAFRTLFNQRDAVALLRREAGGSYWRRVLIYSANHNLQAVLDEYAHYLVDAEGLGVRPPEERAAGVARAMATALSIRPSQIDVDAIDMDSLNLGKFQMRGRFAMRLADYRDEKGVVARLGGVRDAFNSPFRPFVLATTSIGQEGLDFHPYCYRVYHWNLPSNPVDLEQREGRVHRYKGHAVRLNLAEHQAAAVRGSRHTPNDPWALMFKRARSEATIDTGLIPYWIYEGSVRVERRVPMLPFSREVTRLAWLKRSLTVYRLAFGQPRQDDIVDYLQTRLDTHQINAADLTDLQIRLEPPPS